MSGGPLPDFLQRYVPPDGGPRSRRRLLRVHQPHSRRATVRRRRQPAGRGFAAAGVEAHCGPADRLDFLSDASLDVVFASNFFEHLPDQRRPARRACGSPARAPSGRPPPHPPTEHPLRVSRVLGFSRPPSPVDRALTRRGARWPCSKPVEVRARFLPFTTKSAFPQRPALVWLYRKVPIVHRFLGQQSWIVAANE